MIRSTIKELGYHVPAEIITNQDLTQFMDTSDQWIRTRSGIGERRWMKEDEAASHLAIEASKKALNISGIEPLDIDLVVVGTISSDYYFPGVSAQFQTELGLGKIAAFDLKAACSGFIYSLSAAGANIKNLWMEGPGSSGANQFGKYEVQFQSLWTIYEWEKSISKCCFPFSRSD